jgi:AraC-like DNA-binding protein
VTVTIFSTSAVEPARQFDLFYETINAQILRTTPEPHEDVTGFPARTVSFGGITRPCHIIEAPSHTAHRTLRDIRSSDPEQIYLHYMMKGERRARVGEHEFTIGAGHVFALDSRRPFDLIGTQGRYCGVAVGFPAFDVPIDLSARDFSRPEALRAHRLYGLLCATCDHLGSGLERAGSLEVSVLTSVAEWLFRLILHEECPEAVGEEQRAMFAMVSLEMDRHVGNSEFDLDQLCHSLDVSRRYVQRVVERHGTTFSALLRRKRMEFAHGRLLHSRRTIEAIAAESGYSGLSAFYRAFKREFGFAPGAIKRPPR